MYVWLLKLHRWIALAFALPLIIVLGTGLILSFEPWLVTRAIQPGTLTAAKIDELLKKHDASGQARVLVFRSYDKTLTISAGRSGGTVVDVGTGQAVTGPSSMANTMVTMRRLHETLLIDASWLVVASSVAMIVLATLGVLMGWPTFSNTLAGWHKGMAFSLLPLIVLSPLTGIFIAAGISFASPPPATAPAKGEQLRLADAVRIVGERHDLSSLVWLRPQGSRTLVRLVEGGEYRVYAISRDGTTPMPRNWPRLWHEGNFAGGWSALMNVVTSIAMLGLLGTGIWIWTTRQLRRRARRAATATA